MMGVRICALSLVAHILAVHTSEARTLEVPLCGKYPQAGP